MTPSASKVVSMNPQQSIYFATSPRSRGTVFVFLQDDAAAEEDDEMMVSKDSKGKVKMQCSFSYVPCHVLFYFHCTVPWWLAWTAGQLQPTAIGCLRRYARTRATLVSNMHAACLIPRSTLTAG